MSSPQMVIASALGTWYGDPDEWFWTHAGEIVDALDREGYEIRKKAEQ